MKIKHKLVAKCYDKRGHLLSSASNSYEKTHPIMMRLARKTNQSSNKIYLHAEVAALLKAGTTPVHKITVERYGKSGQPLNAMPCPICQEAIRMFGVKLVEYTTGE